MFSALGLKQLDGFVPFIVVFRSAEYILIAKSVIQFRFPSLKRFLQVIFRMVSERANADHDLFMLPNIPLASIA